MATSRLFYFYNVAHIVYVWTAGALCCVGFACQKTAKKGGGRERECDDIQSVAEKSWRKFLWRITTSASILLLLSLVSSAPKLGTRKIYKISRIAIEFRSTKQVIKDYGNVYSIQFEPVHLLSAISLIHRQIVSDSALSVNTTQSTAQTVRGVWEFIKPRAALVCWALQGVNKCVTTAFHFQHHFDVD
jgi:hypothetical protein